jgi:hypothetical protein
MVYLDGSGSRESTRRAHTTIHTAETEAAIGRTYSPVQLRKRVRNAAARILLSARRITVLVPADVSHYRSPLIRIEQLPAFT